MEELDVEKIIISKEELKKYFNENKYVDKEKLLIYYKERHSVYMKILEQNILKINYFLTT